MESVRKMADGMIAATRQIKAPHEMSARAVTETGALTETDETHVMTDNSAAVIPRTCVTTETAQAGSRWNTERGTGSGTETEKGTERGKGMMYIGKRMLQCRKKKVTEEDMEEKKGEVKAGLTTGMNHVLKGWEEEGDVHWTILRKVRN